MIYYICLEGDGFFMTKNEQGVSVRDLTISSRPLKPVLFFGGYHAI
jgi:hypothetical protein